MNATTAAKNSARLDVGQLTAAAEAATGLSDWGTDQTFRIGLEKLAELANNGFASHHRISMRMALRGLVQLWHLRG